MDVTPVVRLIGDFTDAGRAIAPALAAFGFITSARQLLIARRLLEHDLFFYAPWGVVQWQDIRFWS